MFFLSSLTTQTTICRNADGFFFFIGANLSGVFGNTACFAAHCLTSTSLYWVIKNHSRSFQLSAEAFWLYQLLKRNL